MNLLKIPQIFLINKSVFEKISRDKKKEKTKATVIRNCHLID